MTFGQQRRYEVVAANLIIIGTVISVFINYYYKKSFWDAHASRTTQIAIAAVLPLFIWQLYSIRIGKRWAKISYIVLTSIGMVFLLIDYKRTVPKMLASPAMAINSIGQDVLAVVIITLLLLSLRKPIPEPLLATSE